MPSGMTFNGIRKDYVTVLRGRKRPPWAPIKRNILAIPGMPGGYLEDTDTSLRPEDVPIIIEANNMADLQKVKEDLAAWLITGEPCELIFDDEPDRVYYAVADGSLDLEEIVYVGHGVINFICPDPRKYGAEDSINFQNTASFPVGGTTKTDPVISCVINKDTTFVAVSNGDKINLIGNPVKQEETTFQPETPILVTSCDNLTGWTNSSATSIEGSEQAGALKTNGNYFYTDNYGQGSGWHGPAMKTGLSTAIQDFRFDVGLYMSITDWNQAGGIEVALLDSNSRIVALISVTKHYNDLQVMYSRIRAGNLTNWHDVISENQVTSLKTVTAIFRIYRSGNRWTGQIIPLDGGKTITSYWTDDDGIVAAAVTQVQARLLQRSGFPIVDQRIDDINIYQLNDKLDGQVPIIAKAGDMIEFDHKTDIIRKNGIDITKEKAFIGEYFPLTPGSNTLDVEPADCIENVEVRWRPKWL